MKQICPVFVLPHSQKQGMIQAEGLQGPVQPNAFIFPLMSLHNWEPCNYGCNKQLLQKPYHSFFELFASALPSPQEYTSLRLFIKDLITLVSYSQRQVGNETGMGEYGQHYVLCHTEVQVSSVCVFFL